MVRIFYNPVQALRQSSLVQSRKQAAWPWTSPAKSIKFHTVARTRNSGHRYANPSPGNDRLADGVGSQGDPRHAAPRALASIPAAVRLSQCWGRSCASGKARLSEDEIGLQLGHRREATRTTAGYGEWDPDYLKSVADALDDWFAQLQGKLKGKSLFTDPLRKTRQVRSRHRA